MRVRSQAPCRVDLAGGTLDLWPLYLFHENAVTINFAVDLYTSCDVDTRSDSRIVLRSRDLGTEEIFANFDALRAARRYRLPLAALLVRFFAPPCGITLESNSEAPAGAGISGSSSLMISVASALNKLTGSKYTPEKIREIAQNVEAQVIRVPTGSQDYYPALYGGVSAIAFSPAGIERKALAVDPAALDRRFILAYTGAPRNSGITNWEAMKRHITGDRAIHRSFDRITAIACAMRAALERLDWNQAGRLLREEWSSRKRNAPGIATPLIDHLIASARRAGSTGAKVCGAGGGGCVIFLVEPDAKERVSRIIERAGAQVLLAGVAPYGVVVKASR
jgi:D-glycero-alpha-D-manno-heptose-7-phosphate kinase